jgi:hypothetical protein
MLRIIRITWFGFRHRNCRPGLIEKKTPDSYAIYCRKHNDGMMY